MITPQEVDALAERSSVDLRRLLALIAGLHAHRHGAAETANAMRRIVGDPISEIRYRAQISENVN